MDKQQNGKFIVQHKNKVFATETLNLLEIFQAVKVAERCQPGQSLLDL